MRAAILALLVLLSSPRAVEAEPTGLWWADGGAAQVEIIQCDDALCGQIVWLRSPLDEHGCPLRDAENPDAALRERSVIGIQLLAGLRASSEVAGEWSGGEIYDPGSGRTYRAFLRMDGADRLRLRGYLGFRVLGRTTVWTRVRAERQCLDVPRS